MFVVCSAVGGSPFVILTMNGRDHRRCVHLRPTDRQSVAGGSHLSRIVDRASASLPFPLSLCLTHMTGQSTFYVLLIRSEHTVTLSPRAGWGSRHMGTLPVCVTDSDWDSIDSFLFCSFSSSYCTSAAVRRGMGETPANVQYST